MEKTNAAVNILNLTAGNLTANMPVPKAGNSDISFSETLSKTSVTKPVEPVSGKASGSKTIIDNTSKNSQANIKNADRSKTKDVSTGEETTLEEKVAAVIKDLKQKIKEGFEVSDEEIQEAMDILGLEMADLFNQTDLRSLMMQLTGTSDSIELLTNHELYEGIKDVIDFADANLADIANMFDIPKDEVTAEVDFDEVLKAMDVMQTGQGEAAAEITADNNNVGSVNANEAVFSEAAKEENQVTVELNIEKTEPAVENGAFPVKETASSESENENGDFENESFSGNAKEQAPKTEAVRTEIPSVNTQNKKTFEINQDTKGAEQAQPVNTVTQQTVTTLGEIVETVTTYSNTSTENIMRQVTDYIKVNVSNDATSMEMQLHPASLGTINMQIGSQNGQITAHLTVQNELVKSVLESQMVKLLENFNEQGTKVTAIEVSVAAGNLNSQSDNNYSGARENAQGRGKRSRGINLNEIESFDELTDEDKLQAEVMEMNGGSVNYRA